MSDSVERFSERVENYVKYRPGYPWEIIGFLEDKCGLESADTIADIGCGTGLSSIIFLENGNRVIGVEPNAAMRSAAAEYLSGFPNFSIVDGRSDGTGLAEDSVDFAIAAQAFHWFEPSSTRTEMLRILRPGGWICLLWNERQLDSTPFLREYEEFLIRHARDYESVRHENVDRDRLNAFFGKEVLTAGWPNEQVFDLDGLLGRILSSSYMPTRDDPAFETMFEELRSIFAKHAENGTIKVLYDTRLYAAQY